MRMAPAMLQVSSSSQREGCRIIRHWSEVPLCGIGTSGCVSIGMGALGSGPILYVLGAVSLVALIPIWPIIRQYGTVRQQVALLEGVIQEQRQALEELSQRLEDLRAEAENLSAHESEISEHVEVLVEGVDRLEAAAESLAAAITSARQRRDELTAEVQSHRTAFEQLRQELGQRNQDLAALRETVANLQNRLHPIDGLLSQREAASQAFQERLQDLSLSLHDELTLLHEHERAVSRLNESEQLRLSIAELQQHVESCNRNLEQLTVLQQQRLDQTESAQQVAESSLADLTHRLSEIDHHLAMLENASASEPARHNPVPPPE
jgi:chromosome segregation ATPase